MSIATHQLAVDADAKVRPFFNMTLVTYAGQLYAGIAEKPRENYTMLVDLANRLARRSEQLGMVRTVRPGGKTTYLQRIARIEKQVGESGEYVVGARLVFQEFMRLLCAVRADSEKIERISDAGEAAKLLHQSICAITDNKSAEAKEMARHAIKVRIGCGSSGEVFFEKHQEQPDGQSSIKVYLYTGLFADLFCTYTNVYALDANASEADKHRYITALLKLTEIHPCVDPLLENEEE